MTRFAPWLLLAAPLALASPLSTSPYGAPSRGQLPVAPLVEDHHPHGTIDHSYIVVFKEDASPALLDNHFNFLQLAHYSDSLLDDSVASGLRHIYDGGFRGYAGEFTENVLHQIRRMPEVQFIERDQIVRTMDFNDTIVVQKGSPWVRPPSFFGRVTHPSPQGLARISHRKKLSFSTFTKYEYDDKAGEGVDVYVIDTGIYIHHDEFEGRAHWAKTIPNDEDEDGNGHGTHCAGTIASRKYGVAKHAHVYAVKVLGSNGSGSMSDVVAGVEFALKASIRKAQEARAELAATGRTNHKGSVASMSLGGGKSRALEIAVNRAIDKNLHFAVAAGTCYLSCRIMSLDIPARQR